MILCQDPSCTSQDWILIMHDQCAHICMLDPISIVVYKYHHPNQPLILIIILLIVYFYSPLPSHHYHPGWNLCFAAARSAASSPCNYDNGGCQHRCLNFADKAMCQCFAGYKLQMDMKTCLGMGNAGVILEYPSPRNRCAAV